MAVVELRLHGVVMRTILILSFLCLLLCCGCRPDRAEFIALKNRVAQLEKGVDTLATREVRIVDDKGQLHAVLGMRDDGSPALRYIDKDGQNRILLRLHPDGTPVLVMWGKGGKGTSYLAVPDQGPPKLIFFKPDGTVAHRVPKK
jgi:hypothetical protein